MPKAERGTPKDIANRCKAKGLQKLKFYCQMCQKQCRDENGMKCHMTSDSHLRQMQIFSENSDVFLDSFSTDFEKGYLETLKRRHGTIRMNANNVYQEVIQDKHHVHMNSTCWATLSDFVQYLGKIGKCHVEETERGWYITYIERDPMLLERKKRQQERATAERNQELRAAKMMEVQRMEAAKALDRAGGSVKVEASDLVRDGAKSVSVVLKKGGSKPDIIAKKKTGNVFGDDDDDDDDDEADDNGNKHENGNSSEIVNNSSNFPVKNSKTDASQHRDVSRNKIEKHNRETSKNPDAANLNSSHGKRKQMEQPSSSNSMKAKEKTETNKTSKQKDPSKRKENWLHRDIIVRIKSKKLPKYYQRKGIVERVIDKFTAEIEILDSSPKARDGGDVLQIDQNDLETVVPTKEGKEVRIVNGYGRGQFAVIKRLRETEECADLILKNEEIFKRVHYDDISKAA